MSGHPPGGRNDAASSTLSDMQRIRDELRRARHPALALFTAFLLGAILIVLTDFDHLRLIGTDPLAAIGGALAGVLDGYPVLFSGAIGDPGRIIAAIQSGTPEDIAAALRPISETLVSATPFIFAGLGLVGVVPRRPVQPRRGRAVPHRRPGRLRSRRRSWRGTCRRLSPWRSRCSAGPSPAARTRSSRAPQGADGGARGDHDADAQRHRARTSRSSSSG